MQWNLCNFVQLAEQPESVILLVSQDSPGYRIPFKDWHLDEERARRVRNMRISLGIDISFKLKWIILWEKASRGFLYGQFMPNKCKKWGKWRIEWVYLNKRWADTFSKYNQRLFALSLKYMT